MKNALFFMVFLFCSLFVCNHGLTKDVLYLLSHISIFNLLDLTPPFQDSLTHLVIPYQGRALPTEPYQQMKFFAYSACHA